MIDKLQLNLLGEPEIILNGTSLTTSFETAKAQALLFYLAVRGQAHSREVLANLLWGDMPEVTAKRNLTKAVTELRRFIGSYLLLDRQSVALNPELLYEVDVAIFQAAVEGSLILEPNSSDAALAPLRKAINLYRGDFLEGFYVRDALTFEEWVLNQRERLRELVLQALDLLANAYTQPGNLDHATGLAYAARLLALDPWRESAHRQMMILLARSGQRNAALAQYETCRRILAEELGVEPLPETIALYERLKAISSSPPHNLPPPPNPFLGRTNEQNQITTQLNRPDCRLLTIVGPGGIGKTRLALEVARHYLQPELALSETAFSDGVYFVNLTPVVPSGITGDGVGNGSRTADVLASAIADALNFSFRGSTELMVQLLNYLQPKQLLLVLDNFEHLVAEADLLIKMLHTARQIKLLVTSRERLNLIEEWVLELGGLEYPEREWGLIGSKRAINSLSVLPKEYDVSELERYGAVTLFRQRGQQGRPEFTLATEAPAVVRICQLVQGMPLALELAASWLRVLSCSEIVKEIERNRDFLATSLRNMPERHRSMRAVFEQSWQMLAEQEQAAFRKLSVFRGGFRREAAQAVTGASLPTLASLVDKSLLRLTASGRYRIHELLRQFAAEKLAQIPAEEEAAGAAHCRYYAELLQRYEPQLEIEQGMTVLVELRPEADNIRAGWEQAIWPDYPVAVAEIGRYARATRLFYSTQGWYQEGLALFDKALNRLEVMMAEAADVQVRTVYGRVLLQQAMLCQYLSRFVEAEELCQRSLAALEGIAANRDRAAALRRLGALNYVNENYSRAKAYLVQSLSLLDSAETALSFAKTEQFLGMIAYEFKDYREAERLLSESLAVLRAAGELRYQYFGLGYLAATRYALGQPEEAKHLLQECLTRRDTIGDPRTIPHMLYHARGIFELIDETLALEARRVLDKIVVICRENADDWGMAISLNQLGYIHDRLGKPQEAEKCFREALQKALELPTWPMALEALTGLAWLLMNQAPFSAETQQQAMTHLVLVLNHPATTRPTYDKAASFLTKLEAAGLPAEMAAAARRRGQAMTLEALVEEISD